MKDRNDNASIDRRYEAPVLVEQGDFRTVTAGFGNVAVEPANTRFA